MRLKHSFLLALLILPCLLVSQGSPDSSNIETQSDSLINLTEENFDQKVLLGDNERWFIMFYAPWCNHCKAATPTFEEFARSTNDQVRVARVDCEANPRLKQKYTIRGYPTFMLFYKSIAYEYIGTRTIEAWTEFATQKFENIDSQIPEKSVAMGSLIDLNKEDFNSKIFANEESKWMIMFYAPWCSYSKKAMPVFEKLSTTPNNNNVTLGRVNCDANPEIKRRLKISSFPTFMFFSNGEIRKVEGPRTVDAWSKFINGGYKTIPAVEENVNEISFITGEAESQKGIFTLIIAGCIVAVILLVWLIVASRKNQDRPVKHFQLESAGVGDESINQREIEFSAALIR